MGHAERVPTLPPPTTLLTPPPPSSSSTTLKKQQTLLDTYNVARYQEVMARIGGRLGADYVADE